MPTIHLRRAPGSARLQPSVTRGLRAAAGRPSSWNETSRTFDFVLASEKPCRTFRWDGWWEAIEVDEILPMSGLAEIDTLRGAPILNSHSSWRLADVVGVIESARRIEGSQLVCTGRLSEREDVAGVAKDVANGILTSMSVGFQVLEDGIALQRDGDVPLVEVKRWKALEASLVAVPADDTAKIRSASKRKPTKRTGAHSMPSLDAETFKRSLASSVAAAISAAIDAALADEADPAVDDVDAEAEAAAEEARAAVLAKRAAKPTVPAAGERTAADKAAVAGLRAACAKRGLAADFDALEKSGATVTELRGVLAAGMRTSGATVDTTPATEAGKRGKLISFGDSAAKAA